MIAAKAKHPNCMYKWMDWIICPKVNAEVAEWFGEAPAQRKSCAQTADKNFCATFHADDEAYFDQVWYWTTPIAQCLDGRTERHVQGLRRLDHGLDGDQGLTRRARAHGRVGRAGVSGVLHRHTAAAARGLLLARRCLAGRAPTSARSPSCCSSAFWTHRRLHRRRRPQPSTPGQLPRRCSPTRRLPHGDVCARVGVAAAVTVIGAVLAFPIAFYMAKVAVAAARKAARRRGADAAVGELPGEGLRVARRCSPATASSTGRSRRSGCTGPASGSPRRSSCCPTCGCRT